MEKLFAQIRALGTGAATLIIALTLVTLGTLSWTNVYAGVASTKHNLGTTGPVGSNTYSNTSQICVFCHTPHGGETGAEVPLWNQDTRPGTYATYASITRSTLEGEEAPVGSVSLACLSCHDGAQAMDTVLNEPGSGATGTAFAGGSWTLGNTPPGVANLGTDLTNDHPIGIQYAGGGYNATTPQPPISALGDPDFKAAEDGLVNSTLVWWVDTGTTGIGTREKTDMILFTRIVGEAQPYVECATCHDPHTETALFMRTENTGSAVCLACHSK